MSNTLKKSFNERTIWKNHRSSAIYPLDIVPNSDFTFLFINYWKLKNKLENLRCLITLYNQDGTIEHRNNYKLKKHNELNLKKIFKIDYFKGMVEIEFISKKNLRFPFPAISGFYKSPGGLMSVVHSAGRILNKNESSRKLINSLESNFSLKYSGKKKITPFFSLFKGKEINKNDKIVVFLKDKSKKKLKTLTIKNELKTSFSNKIFYLNDLFERKILKRASLCIVKTNFQNIFPRMICGNFYEKLHHYEVTHSFPVQSNKKDFIDNKYCLDKNVRHVSKLPFVKSKQTKLSLKIFPTNLDSDLNGELLIYEKKSKKLIKKKNIYFNSKKDFKEIKFHNKNKEIFGCISLKQSQVPSRINTSHIFDNGNKNKITTDTASGFNSIEYPEKRTHWGSTFLGNEINSEILIRKINYYNVQNTSNGKIVFFNNLFNKEVKIKLKNENYKIINLKNILNKKKINKKISLSWIATFDNPSGIEIFWNSFSKDYILGDHSF